MHLRLEPYLPERHFPLFKAWWEARGNQCLPADLLPPTGAVALDADTPVFIALIYLTNAKGAYLDFCVSSPEARPRVVVEAMDAAITGAIDLARHAGATLIWSATNCRAVMRAYARCGLTRTTLHANFFALLDPAISHDMLVGEEFQQEKADVPK